MNHPDIQSTFLKETKAPHRLLVAFAHPDDESFGPAGTLIHYARRGVALHYICATRGEAGSLDPARLAAYSSLAELRVAELHCAARHLGLAGLHLLNYHDSGMENSPENQNPASLFQAPLAEVVEKVTWLIRQLRPQVVITFNPTGGYFHPDHIKIHQATLAAFQAAGDRGQFPHHFADSMAPYQPQKLYYTAFSQRVMKFAVKVFTLLGQNPAALGKNRDMNLKRLAKVEQNISTKIRVTPYFATVQQAARCHASQLSGHPNFLPGFINKWLFPFDLYSRAIPLVENGEIEWDLFAGVRVDD